MQTSKRKRLEAEKHLQQSLLLTNVCLLLNRISESALSKLSITSKVGADCNAIRKNSFRTAVGILDSSSTTFEHSAYVSEFALILSMASIFAQRRLQGSEPHNGMKSVPWKRTVSGSRKIRKQHVHEQVVKPNTLFTNEAAICCLEM